ncbi:peptidylprolyl isomerase [Paradesertivirga mongoliensis]|uniref:Peptidylprolyl isomerase n=1 Tax=Paradesertivirga mongoliensis TaxID=2100740 RepID=A0ABW4ZJ25_9SPHI|nr:peptidylprolyl isomerase [Pedobacter mongoliensis]
MKNFLSVIFLVLTSFSSVLAQKTTINKIVAIVGDNVILQSDIERDYANYILQGNAENQEIKCYLVQQMLTQKLLSQQAVIDSVTVTDDEVTNEADRRMRALIQRAGGQERLEQFLNRSVIQYKDQIRPDIREQLVARKMEGKITENVSVTPLEVKRFFESIPKDSLQYYNAEVEVGEIVMYPELTKKEKESFRDRAEALRLRIKGGEDFATLARLYSEDPGSAIEGGSLGFFDRQVMVKEFTAMAFKLKPGELSPVFETEHGFHILQVTERRGEQVSARHILIKTSPTPESLNRTKTSIDTLYQSVLNKRIPFSTAASLYSDNNETKYNGGMMLNAENVQVRTTYIPTDKLEPAVFLTIDTMKVGQFSKPELFTARDGKQGYRFLYLKSKTEPHRASLELDFPKLKEMAYEEKVGRTVSEWFEKRRSTTYIKIDPEYQSCSNMKLWVSK